MDQFKLNSPLPGKEMKFFKKAMKCYEQKKYKNGLKYCRQVLSNPKCEKHPDTLAVQALMMYLSGQKEESIKAIKQTLVYDLKNSVSWHVFSLINKYKRNYLECIKGLNQALKFDVDNPQLLMDLGSVQLHLRDFQNSVDSRYKLLKLKSGQRQFWLAYITSLVLAEKIPLALTIISGIIESLKQQCHENNVSLSRILSNVLIFQLYLTCLERKYNDAWTILNNNESLIFDEIFLKELRAEILIKLRYKDKAVRACLELLKLNCENEHYYSLLFSALEFSGSFRPLIIFEYLIKVYPHAIYPRLSYLKLAEGEKFLTSFREFFLLSIEKNQPNFFNSVLFLYKDSSKVSAIQSTVLDVRKGCKDDSSLLYIYFYLAQHYSYLEEWDEAFSYTDKLTSMYPLFVDGLIFKASILKTCGLNAAHLKTLGEAFALDERDRHVIALYSKALIKQGRLNEAEQVLSSNCTKSKSTWDYMKDVQSTWFFQTLSKMFYNSFDYFRSLNVCLILEDFYKTYQHDPLDFHLYCMRKATLFAYYEYQQKFPYLYKNKYFLKTAATAVKTCVCLLLDTDFSENINENLSSEVPMLQMASPNSREPKSIGKIFLPHLLKFSSTFNNCFIAFEFLYILEKPVLLLKVLQKLIEYSDSHPQTLYCHVRFSSLISSKNLSQFEKQIFEHFPSIVKATIPELVKKFPDDHNLTALYCMLYFLIFDYKTKIYLGEEKYDQNIFMSLFDQTLSSVSTWSKTYDIYKKFIFTKEFICSPALRHDFIQKVISKYPDCGLDNLMCSPN